MSKSPLVKHIEAIKAKRPRRKGEALDRLAIDLKLMSNVIYVDFKAKKVIK